MEYILNIMFVLFVCLSALFVWMAFASHQNALSMLRMQTRQETAVELLMEELSKGNRAPEAAQAIDVQIKEYQSAKADLDVARSQLLGSDTVAFFTALWSMALAVLGVKVFSGAEEQIGRFRFISQRIHPMVSAAAIHQSIFISLGTASQCAGQLASSANTAAALRGSLPAIRESLNQASKSAKDPSINEVGLQQIVYDRYLDVIGEIDQALSSVILKLTGAKQDARDVEVIKATVNEIRKELCDDQLVGRWEELARKLDDAC